MAAAVLLALGTLGVSCGVPARLSSIPLGEPGADGPCGVSRREVWNPLDGRHAVFVLEPTGSGSPITGGTCRDNDRPAILLAHGYVGGAPEGYQGLVNHLVGSGFVVLLPGYSSEFDPVHQYRVVDSGFVLGAKASGRIDLARIGVVGHSFGGGMVPWLVQQSDARGWGKESLWAVVMAPWFALQVGSGPIELPVRTRFTVVNYEEDYLVDARIGIEMASALDLPRDQVTHVMLRSDRRGDPPLIADHMGPVSVELMDFLGVISTDHFDRWSAWRTIDATAGCAMDDRWCDTDLTDVGHWPDGRAVRPALVSDQPADLGPPALQECDFVINPRPCPN